MAVALVFLPHCCVNPIVTLLNLINTYQINADGQGLLSVYIVQIIESAGTKRTNENIFALVLFILLALYYSFIFIKEYEK